MCCPGETGALKLWIFSSMVASKVFGVGLVLQKVDLHPNNWQHPGLILMEPVPCWKASNIWCVCKWGHQMLNLYSLNWVTSLCLQGVTFLPRVLICFAGPCWRAKLHMLIHICHTHLTGKIWTRFHLSLPISAERSTLLLTSFFFLMISNGTGAPSFTKRLADWIKTQLHLAGNCCGNVSR